MWMAQNNAVPEACDCAKKWVTIGLRQPFMFGSPEHLTSLRYEVYHPTNDMLFRWMRIGLGRLGSKASDQNLKLCAGPLNSVLYPYSVIQVNGNGYQQRVASLQARGPMLVFLIHSALECIKMRSDTIILDLFRFSKISELCTKWKRKFFCKQWVLICRS